MKTIKKRTNSVAGVLFDFDGTLTKPGSIDFVEIKRKMGCSENLPILEYIDTLSSTHKHEMIKILEIEEEKAALASLPNTRSEELLLYLKKKQIKFGIITRNSLKSVQTSMRNFTKVDIADFSIVIARDDVTPKPDPAGVFMAASKMGVAVSELLVVGDFRFDIMAGHRAGATTVFLKNGSKTNLAPEDPTPDYLIKSLYELTDFFC